MSQAKLESSLSTKDSLAFVMPRIPARAVVLEVGCGAGELAQALVDENVALIALDSDADAIEQARKRGVPAIHADFLKYELPEESLDVMLFARSLHHIHPIETAVQRAARFLKPGGTLVIDDFGADLVDEKTAIWFYGTTALLKAALQSDRSGLAEVDDSTLTSDIAVKRWRDHHFIKHHVAGFEEMRAALLKHFTLEHEERLVHLYRYFERDYAHIPEFAPIIQRMHDWEDALCRSGGITPVGVRWVFRRQ